MTFRVFISPCEASMPTLQTRCSVQTKNRFHALACAEGLKESILLRRMVTTVIAHHLDAVSALPRSDTRGGQGGHSGRVMLRLRPTETRAIRALAEPEGYSASAWIVRQLRYRLEGAIPFAKDELNELRDALRELGAVGRNLNSLVHILRRSDRLVGDLLYLPDLADKVERMRRALTATMTRATHRGSASAGG
ncbi:MAG: hypothetical protein ACREU2_17400 [Steroidobacteraceae bacterium]